MQHRGEEEESPRSVSDLALCIQSLANEGRAVISAQNSGVDDSDALPVLQQLDVMARDEFALDLPVFSPATALWGARLFHQLCRFVVCREIGAEAIDDVCKIPCPESRGPEADWSVDLTLRHLPKLFQLARHLSNADPLVEQMKKIAIAWPLSSVGIADLEKVNLDSFIKHSGLRRLYADRVIAAGDTSRLGDPRMDDLLRADLSIHHELAPAIATNLFEIAK